MAVTLSVRVLTDKRTSDCMHVFACIPGRRPLVGQFSVRGGGAGELQGGVKGTYCVVFRIRLHAYAGENILQEKASEAPESRSLFTWRVRVAKQKR